MEATTEEALAVSLLLGEASVHGCRQAQSHTFEQVEDPESRGSIR